MKKSKCLLALVSCLLCGLYYTSHSQTIPWATQQPAWVFPIWFMDGAGERDTIYVGYDRNATLNLDTVFGEKWFKTDTSKFNAAIFFGWGVDSVMKVVARDSTWLSGAISIDFYKGVMPLTMYWYDSLFYSDSLPFPDLDPAPRAKGAYMCSDAVPSGNCNPDVWYIMCDTFNFMDNISPFKYSDSVVFVGTSGEITVGGFLLQIVDWNAVLVSIVPDKSPEEKFFIYPNPATNHILIKVNTNYSFLYRIYNVMGEIVISGNKTGGGEVHLNLSDLSCGIYFVQVQNKKSLVTKKFIKME